MGQTLSSTNFFFYGRKHFTAKGYAKHVKAYYSEPVAASATAKVPNVDLTGKVVVVTGANSGLGKEVSTYAAARGATVYMLCRSPDRAAKAQAEIVAATGNDKVHVIKVDVSELAHIRRAAAELQSKESKIHALVCNAGVILKERKVSAGEGYEQTFASHLLGGSYLLSKLLLPQVRAADGEGRIVITTSGTF
jgi:dehydrogenase/reductase SDR family protein 12